MLRELRPSVHTGDAVAHKVAIPGLVEEEDLDPRIGERLGDHDVVLAEGVEDELFRKAGLVLGRAGRVIPATGVLGSEVADRLEVDGLGVVEDALLAQPGLGDVAPAFGARGDEVQLVARRHHLLEDSGAILVHLELAEEGAVVELDAETVALIGRDVRVHIAEQMPSDLAFIGELDAVFLRELPQIGDRADRHYVVEIDADLQSILGYLRPMRMIALNAQCAAMLVITVPVATRRRAMIAPPMKRNASAPAIAGTIRTEGTVVFTTVNTPTVPCQSENAIAEAMTA